MPWVRAAKNPTSQQSLYGDTAAGTPETSAQSFGSDLFWQNPDGSFLPGADPTQMLEQSYQNSEGLQGGGGIYGGQYGQVDNPPWWDLIKNNPLIGGRNYADIEDINSNPQIDALNQQAQVDWGKSVGWDSKVNFGEFAGDLAKFFGPTIGAGLGLSALGGAFGGAGAGTAVAGGGADSALGGYGFTLGGNSIAGGVPGAFSAAIPANLATLANLPTGIGGVGGGGAGPASLPDIPPGSVGPDYNNLSTNFGGPNAPIIPAAGGSFLDQLMQSVGGTGSTGASTLSSLLGASPDLLKLLGTVGATGLGAYAANQQTDAFKDLADKYMGFGAPSRARYEGSFAPGFSMQNEPGYTDAIDSVMQSYLRKASTGGNPFDNPGVSQEILKGVNSSLAFPALQNYRNQNAATGGYSAFNTAAPGAAATAIGTQGGALTNIAGGLSDLVNPQPQPQQFNLADLMRRYGINMGGSFT